MVDPKRAAKLKLISDVKEYCRTHSIKSAVRCFHIGRNTVRNYIRNEFEKLQNYNSPTVKRRVIASKSEIIKYICFNEKLASDVKTSVFRKYPILIELKKCIREFRRISETKNPVLLRMLIDNYLKSEIKKIQGFVKGLIRDFDAVDLAVSSNLSNGFVEGINNKIKLIKRVMFGRCRLSLLKAKIILPYFL